MKKESATTGIELRTTWFGGNNFFEMSQAYAANCICKNFAEESARWVQSFNTVHKLRSIEKKNLGSKIVWNTYH